MEASTIAPIGQGEVLLHVGLHKTGTTALQVALSDARPVLPEHGVKYPGKGLYHHRAILAGADRHWVGHNVVFDFYVVDQYLRHTGRQEALAAWWQIAADGRLHDTMLLERLIALAQTDEPPERTKELLSNLVCW